MRTTITATVLTAFITIVAAGCSRPPVAVDGAPGEIVVVDGPPGAGNPTAGDHWIMGEVEITAAMPLPPTPSAEELGFTLGSSAASVGPRRIEAQATARAAADAGLTPAQQTSAISLAAPDFSAPQRAQRAVALPTIGEDAVVQVVKRRKGQVRACYEQELKGQPYLGGVIEMEWTVTAAGEVRDVKVLDNNTGNQDIEACFTRIIGTWSFPASDGAAVDVQYPFRLTPSLG